METNDVKIDFDVLNDTVGEAMLKLAREKAIKANSTIIYQEDNILMEENPVTGTKKIFQYHNAE